MYSVFLKRIFDAVVTSLLLVIPQTIFVFFYALVRLYINAPVLFVQHCKGKDGTSFLMVKYPCTKSSLGAHRKSLPDEHGMTKFVNLLHIVLLDKLQKLINVICCNIRLIGQRSLLPYCLGTFIIERNRR